MDGWLTTVASVGLGKSQKTTSEIFSTQSLHHLASFKNISSIIEARGSASLLPTLRSPIGDRLVEPDMHGPCSTAPLQLPSLCECHEKDGGDLRLRHHLGRKDISDLSCFQTIKRFNSLGQGHQTWKRRSKARRAACRSLCYQGPILSGSHW
jgi:hypothetical protein